MADFSITTHARQINDTDTRPFFISETLQSGDIWMTVGTLGHIGDRYETENP